MGQVVSRIVGDLAAAYDIEFHDLGTRRLEGFRDPIDLQAALSKSEKLMDRSHKPLV